MAGHWYNKLGEANHEVLNKSGVLRPSTLADAKKNGWLPSVTTIMSIQDKPALTEWLTTQLLDATIQDPFHPQEWNVDNYKKVMKARMRSVGNKAAERGTDIHRYLDNQFRLINGEYDIAPVPKAEYKYIYPALKLIEDEFGVGGWVSEQSFASTSQGYAGSVDLHHPEKNIVIDFKTKDKPFLKGVKQYDDHKIQLAAYQHGLGLPEGTRRYNLFISTSSESPGECLLLECEEYKRYLSLFLALNIVWQIKNKYYPGEQHDTI
jgi:hypothetical protein